MIEVFHGTAHDFKEFSLDHLGKGEGNQAFGWGLYFAQEPHVARYYQKKLTSDVLFRGKPVPVTGPINDVAYRMLTHDVSAQEAIDYLIDEQKTCLSQKHWGADQRERFQETLSILSSLEAKDFTVVRRKSGRLIRVEIPDGPYLDWDKDYSDQSPETKKILQKMCRKYPGHGRDNLGLDSCIEDDDTGQLFYYFMSNYNRNVIGVAEMFKDEYRKTSLDLLAAGIVGIRYLDHVSRDGLSQTTNFVIFSAKLVKITSALTEARTGNRGAPPALRSGY